jgi:hypothetical protein
MHDLDDPLPLGDERMHDVAGTNHRRRLCRGAIDAHVPAVAQLGRHGPCLDQAHCAQPAIDSRLVGQGFAQRDGTNEAGSGSLRVSPGSPRHERGASAGRFDLDVPERGREDLPKASLGVVEIAEGAAPVEDGEERPTEPRVPG